ncbi:MAG: PKD domain-containing protein [Myxococcales bacterium]
MKRMEGLLAARTCFAAHRIEGRNRALVAPLLAALLYAGGAHAQQIPSPTPQFDMLGFIQSATLDGSICPQITDQMLWGGTIMLNNVKMTVPCNTIIQMPANTITWAQLFPVLDANGNIIASYATPQGTSTVGLNGQAQSQAPGQTGLALSDTTTPGSTAGGPFPSFEVRVVGNVVKNAAGKDQYIVGLIAPVSQQGLNAGSGTINCIDYQKSFLYVGGDPAQPCTLANGAPNGARIQINDPIGRWGQKHSPDPRFAGDTNNTTVHAASGFPMCVPRVAPTSAADGGDPLCPKANRPLNGDPRFPTDVFLATGAPLRNFDMLPPPGQPGADPSGFPDARQQVPFMVGDWIDYSGTVAKDSLGNVYVTAHTITAQLGIYTAPGVQPAYVSVETILLGSGGTPVNTIAQEATTRIFIVGFTTDPINLIDVNAVDVNPCTGVETLRLLGTVDPLTQPVRGRFRFHVLGGQFMPPTREMIIQSHTGTTPPSDPFDPTLPTFPVGFANGLGSGQYRLPNFDFIFPENFKLGDPILPNNFQDFPFLAQGSGPLFGSGTIVGQLTPWPGSPNPPAVTCSPAGGAGPIASAGVDFVVATGLREQLAGTVTQDPNATAPTITWAQTAGPAAGLNPTSGSLTPSFSTVGIPAGSILTFRLTVTDNFGTSTAVVNVRVVASPPPDTLTVTAVWRAPIGGVHKVGVKGGQLRVAITESITDPTIRIQVIGWGEAFVSQVAGLPNYIFRADGVPAPASVTVRSSLGAEATVPVTIR